MSYPLYKETNYDRSCSLTPDQLQALIDGINNGIEVHSSETGQSLRYVSREEVLAKWNANKILGFVRSNSGKFIPSGTINGKIVFYRLRW